MEQQPGPVNWAPYNPAPLPGMVRLWTWEAIAHGAEVVSYFRWRQAPFGQEQMHAGLQRPDAAWADGSVEARKVAAELAALPETKTTPSQVAIVFDYASAWAWDTQPQGQDFDYFRLVYDVYRGLRRLGLSVDILSTDTDDFDERRLVCIPGLFAWTPELRRAVDSFSGQLLLGPRTGSKTGNFKIPSNMPPDVPNFDCRVTSVETLRPSAKIDLEKGGSFHIWREYIQTIEHVSEKSADGNPAIISKDNLRYLAGWPDDAAMTRILRELAEKSGLETELMQGGERRRNWGNFTLNMNYDSGEIQLINNATKQSLL